MTRDNIKKPQDVLLDFMANMYSWERKATKSLRSKEYILMLKDELSNIFQTFCTPKKSLRSRENLLSVGFPFDYKPETHPITKIEENGKCCIIYVDENRSGLALCYRYHLVFKKGKWWIHKKEWFYEGKWKNHHF